MIHGEYTITLEDVAIQLRLYCDRFPVYGHTPFPWVKLCQYLLRVLLLTEQLDRRRLSVTWIVRTFNLFPLDDEVIR